MVKKYLRLSDIRAYVEGFNLSNKIWNTISKWGYFEKNTVGMQFVRAVDSISANIAEGFGRYHKKDKQKFYYNARASVYESLDWLQKLKVRKLVSDKEYREMYTILSALPKEVNHLISYTEDRLRQ